jgi:hypothetical protein
MYILNEMMTLMVCMTFKGTIDQIWSRRFDATEKIGI